MLDPVVAGVIGAIVGAVATPIGERIVKKIWGYWHARQIHLNEEIAELKTELSNYVKIVSANNMSESQSTTNSEEMRKIIKCLERIDGNRDVKNHFHGRDVDVKDLENYIYLLYVSANRYMFNHNGRKAREELELAKKTVEDYVSSQLGVAVDFEQVDALDRELRSNFVELPKIYAQVIYSLGRTYIYEPNIDEMERGNRYFANAKILGNGLFTKYLSDRSGIATIKIREIEQKIKEHKYQEAKAELNALIALFQDLRNDSGIYLEDYKPTSNDQQNIEPKKLKPKNDISNQIECLKQLTGLYLKLICISGNIIEKTSALQNLSDYFTQPHIYTSQEATTESVSVLEFIYNDDKITGRRAAAVYNVLGNCLLTLMSASVSNETFSATYHDFKNTVIRILNLKVIDDLEVIWAIYEKARDKCSKVDFTKADSYKGLIKICQKQLERTDISTEERQSYETKMAGFTTKKDAINHDLNRIDENEDLPWVVDNNQDRANTVHHAANIAASDNDLTEVVVTGGDTPNKVVAETEI